MCKSENEKWLWTSSAGCVIPAKQMANDNWRDMNCEYREGIYKLALDHLRESILHLFFLLFMKTRKWFPGCFFGSFFSDIYKIANFQKIIPQTEHDKRGHQSIIYLMDTKKGLKNMERIKNHKGEKWLLIMTKFTKRS